VGIASSLALVSAVPRLDDPPAKSREQSSQARGAPSTGEAWGSEPNWPPPDVDQAIPPVAAGVPCSLPVVLQSAGQRMKQFVENAGKFTATEQIVHREARGNGNWRPPVSRSLEYIVEIHEIRPGMLNVEEYRNGSLALDRFPSRYAFRGLPALVLIFHPYYMDDYQMTCEGLGQWRGQPAWQVHFRHRSDRPSRIWRHRANNKSYDVKVKGRAWIAAEDYHLLHLETDLAEPIRQIRLERQHVAVEYRPMKFRKGTVQLWLPESAETQVYFEGHRLHDRHTFSNYLLFTVETIQKFPDPPTP
jgi:hypothetical protein